MSKGLAFETARPVITRKPVVRTTMPVEMLKYQIPSTLLETAYTLVLKREIQKFISKLSFCVPAGLNDPSFQLLPHHSLGHGTTTGTFGTAGAVRLDSTGLQATVVKEAAEMTASRVGSWRIKGRKNEKIPKISGGNCVVILLTWQRLKGGLDSPASRIQKNAWPLMHYK